MKLLLETQLRHCDDSELTDFYDEEKIHRRRHEEQMETHRLNTHKVMRGRETHVQTADTN